MCTSLFASCSLHDGRSRNITFCIHLMFCAKNIERMGDHAPTSPRRALHGRGKPIAETRPKGDTTAFAKAALT